ncbi:MAG TPA: hydrogenase assembly protein HupF [Sporomusaceae bacterium]|nr:hydrogenase assembly protein HupF [Sporomusaceae bacterium]
MKSITTLKVNCKDCHRCVRSCPVKAIGIDKGQARVVENRCIVCGRCVTECPQKAKQVKNQVMDIKNKIAYGYKVVMSLAPSFISSFPEYQGDELIQAIKNLGFTDVEETAIGAEIVSAHYSRMLEESNEPVISACCPVVVNVIKTYYPELVKNIAPVVSPMVAHGKVIKQRSGNDTYVVFAGPCVAKIGEAEKDANSIDAVITFEQLRQWLIESQHNNFTEKRISAEPQGRGRYFPISGGILKSFMDHDETDTEIITVDGIENCMETFDALIKGDISPRFIEALACSGGCIGGPVSGNRQCMAAKRRKVINYAKSNSRETELDDNSALSFTRIHQAMPVAYPLPTEAEIVDILSQTGKTTAADEKNCGACGYNSCRDKAIAVFQGLAENDMCVPYMRSKAESFANIIVTNSLNAIIVVDQRMIIQDFNPAAQKMFDWGREMATGMNLGEIMDCAHFVYAAKSGNKVVGKRIEYGPYGLVTEQMIIPVPKHDVIIAIITDVTEQEKKLKELELMKLETIKKATQVIDKQMHVAQEIAGLLGETTAETKSALLEVIWLLKGKEEA